MQIARLALILAFMLPAAPVAGGETVGTFTLDGFSLVSFGDDTVVQLPLGSTIVFRFDEPTSDGSASFTIHPEDVRLGEVALPSGGTLRYEIVKPARGWLRRTTEGRTIAFEAVVRATLETGSSSDGSQHYSITFTTEAVSAYDRSGTDAVSATGTRLDESFRYARMVGATTNESDAFPAPGSAVYTVLSGSFDLLP